MRSFLSVFLLVLAASALVACQADDAAPTAPAPAAPAPLGRVASDDLSSVEASDLAGRLWVAVHEGAAPGQLRAFSADGFVLQTSCAETYRVSPYRLGDDGTLTITEDGADIPARYLFAGDELVLTLTLAGGETREERYRAVAAPSACPDLR